MVPNPVRGYDAVCSILADDALAVSEAEPDNTIGTIGWLRASVSRFSNGAEHATRRAVLDGEIARLDPSQLHDDARRRARLALLDAAGPGVQVEVMALLARRIPTMTLAAALGADQLDAVSDAVVAIAAGYFGAGDAAQVQAANDATTALLTLLGPAEVDVLVARMCLLVQGCDATAGLIGNTLLQLGRDSHTVVPTMAYLTETLRFAPPVRAIRREISRAQPPRADPEPIRQVVCDVDAANRDPAVFEHPDRFDADRHGPASLTFGYGVRPCPGQAQALALAAGVIDAVRENCVLPTSEAAGQVPYEPGPLRIPQRIELNLAPSPAGPSPAAPSPAAPSPARFSPARFSPAAGARSAPDQL